MTTPTVHDDGGPRGTRGAREAGQAGRSRGSALPSGDLSDTLYEQLRALAAARMADESREAVLTPTSLVHEAVLRIGAAKLDWKERTRCRAVAALAMKRVLVDAARRRDRRKRGGDWQRVALDGAFADDGVTDLDALALHDALERLRALDPRQADVVEYRGLGGLTGEETAELLDVSLRTVAREWKAGLAWLRRELVDDDLSEETNDDVRPADA